MKNKLIKDEIIVLIVLSTYFLASSMVNTFANVYLLNLTNSLLSMSLFALARFSVFGFASFVAAKIAYRYKINYALIIGLLTITLAITLLLSLNEYLTTNIYLIFIIAFIWGCGEGFFWISINTLMQLITSTKTRSYFLGLNGALQSVAAIIAPLISAFILSTFTKDGYFILFRFAIMLFVLISILSFKISANNISIPFNLRRSIYNIKHDSKWRFILVAQFFLALRESATLSLTALLIYKAIGNDVTYGQWLSLFALGATFSNYFIGRNLRSSYFLNILRIGTFTTIISCLALVFYNTINGAFIHGFLHYIFTPWLVMPFNSLAMLIIAEYIGKENIMRKTVMREIVISIGRFSGLIIIICFDIFLPNDVGLKVSLLILYASTLIYYFIVSRYFKQTHTV